MGAPEQHRWNGTSPGIPLSGIKIEAADAKELDKELARFRLAPLDVALHSDKNLARSIPAGTPWWTFDSDTDFCSRFAVLFPGPIFPSSFTTWATATFTGAEDTVAVSWNNPFTDTTYKVMCGAANITDGGPPVVVDVDGTTQTTTGITVRTSSRFTGTVDLVAYQVGAVPFADLHLSDLARLRSVIGKWRPAKATCVGAYAVAQGKFSAWPVGTMAQMLGVPSTIVNMTGSF